MTATVSSTIVQDGVEYVAVQKYEMPRPEVGDPILWFSAGDSTVDGHPGMVLAVGEQSVDIVTHAPRQMRAEVSHMTDPRIKSNKYVRDNGGWDWTPAHKMVRALYADMMLERATAPETAEQKQKK